MVALLVENQKRIFDIQGFSSPKIRKPRAKKQKPKPHHQLGKKRGHYKPRSKVKPYCPIKDLKNIYQELYKYDCPILKKHELDYDYELYEYEGHIEVGEVFSFKEAEIIGSEKLYTPERIYIHRILLEELKNKTYSKNTEEEIYNLIDVFMQGVKIWEWYTLLIFGGLNGKETKTLA